MSHFRVSNWFVGIVNSVTLLFGLGAAITGLYFLIHRGTQCQHSLAAPLLIPGAFVALVSIFGVVGVWKRNNAVMVVYLTVMLFLILGIIGFTVFVGYSYKNGSYKHLLDEDEYVSRSNWDPIRTCLAEGHLCRNFGKKSHTSIQLGCCKPPSNCGFHFKNATFWEVTEPISGPAPYNPDCRKWSNNKDKMCYNCNSCKYAFLENFKSNWKKALIFNICLLVVLIGVYLVSCCAWRHNRRDALEFESCA